VSDRLAEFGGAAVVLITFTRPRNLSGSGGVSPWPIQCSPMRPAPFTTRTGLRRGSWWRVWGLKSVRAYGRLLRHGRRLERPSSDTLQLGGDFVVDRDGRLAYAYRSRGPDDRPTVDDLVDAVRSCH
jgi:hypothetical protein